MACVAFKAQNGSKKASLTLDDGGFCQFDLA